MNSVCWLGKERERKREGEKEGERERRRKEENGRETVVVKCRAI